MKPFSRIFGSNPALQRETVELDLVLGRQQTIGGTDHRAFGHPDLGLDDVDTGHFLGDRVLDLNARIDFDEVELVGIGIHQEFDGAGVRVADLLAQSHSGIAELDPAFLRQVMRRCALDHLLIAALHRAIALEQVDQIAVLVTEHLHFDMASAANELFEIGFVIAERGQRFATCRFHCGRQFCLVLDGAHAAATAAPAGLEHHRIADFSGDLLHFLDITR